MAQANLRKAGLQQLYTPKLTMEMTKEEAEQLVYAHIKREGSHAMQTDELVIMHEQTLEKEYGWVFFYQTKKYLKTGDFLDALAGNAPYIVNKYTGEIISTGTANPFEDYIAEYEARIGYGDKHSRRRGK